MSKNDNKAQPKRRQRSTVELQDLKTWVSTLQLGAVTPKVHVNGHTHPTALVVVDLGSPLKQVRLTGEQVAELHQRLRRVAKEILNRDAQVRATADHPNGIHWASVA